jgi:hypothetical protein
LQAIGHLNCYSLQRLFAAVCWDHQLDVLFQQLIEVPYQNEKRFTVDGIGRNQDDGAISRTLKFTLSGKQKKESPTSSHPQI